MCRTRLQITKACFLAATVALLCAPPRAQGQQSRSTNADFYPLGLGDYWVYWDYGPPGSFGVWDTITVQVLKDSTIAGKKYRMTEGHSWHYGNTWRLFYRADTLGNILSVDPATGSESIKYRLSDTSRTWWDNQLRRFDSSAVLSLFGDWRRCLYVGNYNSSNGDTVLYSTEMLIEKIGFYVTFYMIIDGGPTILAGGSIGGVPFGSVADVRGQDMTLPVGIALHPPYPNPFNPTATISYSLPQRCHIHLQIDDILGEQVALLCEGAQEPGVHYVVWDGSGRASGIYLCRLQAGGVTQTRRLLLLR